MAAWANLCLASPWYPEWCQAGAGRLPRPARFATLGKLIKDDQAAFEAIYSANAEKFIQDSNVTQNFIYFCGRIDKTKLTADQLRDAIERLMIIDIKLDKEDDAQRIFESLNSTGLDLNEGDKIRNFILMGLDARMQEEYYEKYWNEIEKNRGFGSLCDKGLA